MRARRQQQESGGGNEKRYGRVPPPFCPPVRVPAIDLHQEKRRKEWERAPQSDMKVSHAGQPLEHEREPKDESVLPHIGEEGQTREMADEGRPQSITET